MKRPPIEQPARCQSSEVKSPAVASVKLRRFEGGKLKQCDDSLAREEPLEIRIRGQSIAVTMRTPGHDEELALGFLLSEGIISKRAEVIELAHCQDANARGNVLNVFLSAGVEFDAAKLARNVFASSSCGICGKGSIEAVHQHFEPLPKLAQINTAMLLGLPIKMRAAQATFDHTGGLHAAALFDAKGNLLVLREDVGRHNAVDKVIGFCLRGDIEPGPGTVLLVSGRASFEIMQKALAARIPIVAAISAPSSLAVDFARESNQALVGFLRPDKMNIYSAAQG
jgi:FdhD protein